MRSLAKSLLFLIFLLLAVPALARADPPTRVGRVSLVSGTLAFYGPGDTDWSAAKVNLPVAAGAWLMTDPQSRVEMRVGADSIDLSNDTQLNFAELRDQVMQIALTQGRLDLHLRRLKKDETAEIDLPYGRVLLLQPGVYDIDSGRPDQPTRITVFEGSARFVGGGIDTVVNAGDVLVLRGSDTLSAAAERAVPDDFVRWCRSHDYDEKRLAAPRHVAPAMTGYEELDAYGEWAAVPTYGEVWFPTSLPGGWAPYRDGRWVWIEPWGWNWVDDEPWGFAPCHYGRWARVDDRWAWVPGDFAPEPVYAPALVAFIPPPAIAVPVSVPVDAGPPVGWFPLAPGEIYWPAYTRNPVYIRNVNITNVNITKINTIIAAQPAAADPPPQVASQQFANRAAATVVPARVLVESSQVASAAVTVSPQVLRGAAVAITPPVLPRPAATARTAPALTSAPPSSPARHATPPAPGGAIAPTQPASSTAAPSTAPAATRPPGRPNFSQLAPAPRVGSMPVAAQQSSATPSSAPATSAGNRQPSAPVASASQPSVNAATPAPTLTRPPNAPEFSHLAPTRIGPHPVQQPVQAAPGSSSPVTGATASEPRQSASEMPGTREPAPTTWSPATGHPPGAPDFARLPAARPGPHPTQATSTPPGKMPPAIRQPARAEPAPAPPTAHTPPGANGGTALSLAPGHAAQERTATEAAARQQAQQRAAAEAVAQRQAQQRTAAEAAARQQAAAVQQAQQRAAAEAAARQQVQQHAAAEAAARQQAAAAQQAQQRAAAEAAARQQAAQQAQQRATVGAVARQQHAEACGHPGQPPCPK